MTRFEVLKKEILPTIPHKPGVYKYFDVTDNILYVGKAKNLRRRVGSYFTSNHPPGKTRIMVKRIHRIEFAVVETEQDALLLENVLIKKLQPKYNILLKDDKSYPYICITNERFPRVLVIRKLVKDGSSYLGPYTSVNQVYNILDFLREMFTIRTCQFNLSEKNVQAGKYKLCLEYHIGKCKGPCTGLQSESEYMETIAQVKKILKGNISSVIKYLKNSIKTAVEKLDFEQAHHIQQKLQSLENYQSKSTIVNPNINNVDVFNIDQTDKRAYVSYLTIANGTIIRTKIIELTKQLDNESTEDLLLFGMISLREQFKATSTEIIAPYAVKYPKTGVKVQVPKIGDKKKLLDLAKKNAFYYRRQYEIKNQQHKTGTERVFETLSQLKKDLRLTEIPYHIECFDNSNFQGSFPVAAMVCFKNAKPYKKAYRHFKIKTVEGPNDFASMEEVVYRRYKRLIDEEKPLPQLVLIDGGKGQLTSALAALKNLNITEKLAVVGIAKKLEEIYVPNDPIPLHIDKRSQSLKLLQQLRNEAHRFAISFHKNLRSKNAFNSELESIKGIGKKSVSKLLAHFKSVNAIKKANATDLAAIVNKKQAAAIVHYFSTKKLSS